MFTKKSKGETSTTGMDLTESKKNRVTHDESEF